VDVKIGADPGPMLVRNERRDHARSDHHPREASPGVIVEIGRPIDSAGTYSARGVVDGQPQPPRAGVAPAPGSPVPITADRVRAEAVPMTATPLSSPESLRVPSNAQMQNLASASPQSAIALRAGPPLEAAHLHPPPLALTAGIQTLAPNALKQAEKGNAAAEHEEDTDSTRKEKDVPVRDNGKRRGR
jgi:hypothetical protein